MKVLVIGANGMIGNTVLRVLSEQADWDVSGTVRSGNARQFFPPAIARKLTEGVEVESADVLLRLLESARPDVVVNCAGLTKHKPEAEDPLVAIPINTIMPHRLAALCSLIGTRLVHISTDCVFSGEKGHYSESDFADARDVYGKSKALGEVVYPHCVTVRTSTIGPELQTRHGLLAWFLAQGEHCKGFTRAIFSGLPTVLLAQVLRDVVIPRTDLSGLYHLAATPISKYDLLKLIAAIYEKKIDIRLDDSLKIDRSLDAAKFQAATGYVAPDWPEMIRTMHTYNW